MNTGIISLWKLLVILISFTIMMSCALFVWDTSCCFVEITFMVFSLLLKTFLVLKIDKITWVFWSGCSLYFGFKTQNQLRIMSLVTLKSKGNTGIARFSLKEMVTQRLWISKWIHFLKEQAQIFHSVGL